MSDIDLGFSEDQQSEWLVNRYFPSKVGGKPAWLELEKLPKKEQLQCSICKSQKSFLCQIYAPFGYAETFHRTIFVFICRSTGCQKENSAENLTVLRSQLSRKNDFYSYDPPIENDEPLPAIPTKSKLCLACGAAGPLICSRCKKAEYCCAQHQRAHWPQHKPICSSENKSSENAVVNLPSIVFPESEIAIEINEAEENSSDSIDTEAEDKARLEEYEELAAAGKTGALQNIPDTELDQYAQGCDELDDKQFRKFKKEVDKYPEQILRYKVNGTPLWITAESELLTEQLKNIPKCQNCGSERQFEFQIMPQMLLSLKDEHVDWGVLAIYTCVKSCQPDDDVGYLEEYIIKQDITGERKIW